VSLTGLVLTILATAATVVGLFSLLPDSHACRSCDGIGTRRGANGRWATHCRTCRGSGQRDSLVTRALVVITRGRHLPGAGSAATGHMHGPGYVFAGRRPGGAWRADGDPADTRLEAIERRRVPALERRVERREAAVEQARGIGWAMARARLAAARRALRRARSAAEDHRAALMANGGGYRRRRT